MTDRKSKTPMSTQPLKIRAHRTYPSMFRCLNQPSDSEEGRTSSTNWLDLPRDVMWMILVKLGAFEILRSAQHVCTLWRNICKDPHIWRTIDMRNLRISRRADDNLCKMCRCAIDQSCGQLVDLSVEYFCDDDLLNYMADSKCHHLRCLRLVHCYVGIEQGLIEIAKKLPWLEELEITLCSASSAVLEAVGRCCPLLKSLKFHEEDFNEGNEEAFAVARTMPQLRHLRLYANSLDNVGLLAILDGCPHLESLDLRECSNVDLEGSLAKRCAEQIKDLRHPDAPTDDYQFAYPYYYHATYKDNALDYETMIQDYSPKYIFEDRDREVAFIEDANQCELESENMEWEQTDALWEIVKTQRPPKVKKSMNCRGFQRSRRGNKSTNSKGKKQRRKAERTNLKSLCSEEELW